VPYKDPSQQQASSRRSYLKNSQAVKDRAKVWKKANSEKVKLRNRIARRKYCKANPDHVKTLRKAWGLANPEKEKAYRERGRERYRIWRQANRERRNSIEKEYRESDPIHKLLCQYRSMLHLKLKQQRAEKSKQGIELLGCDIQWLAAWLEVQFQSGMTWENYGPVWHVDHKRPCASFDLSDPVQQRLCFHWTNLQPLFAEENLRKGAKWENLQAVA
jgi:hypothetical protein